MGCGSAVRLRVVASMSTAKQKHEHARCGCDEMSHQTNGASVCRPKIG